MNGKIIRSISVILTLVLVFSIITCAPFSVNAEETSDTYLNVSDLDESWDCNWMSHLSDEIDLNELSIPGVHDACAVDMDYSTWLGHFAQTQNYFIYGQLCNGVRYFDLRVGKEDGQLTMCHSSIYLNGYDGKKLRLKTVIEEDMLPFLSYHKGETLILQIKCDDEDCDWDIYNYFKSLLTKYPDKIYCGYQTPRLWEARGKLVILSRLELTKSNDEIYKNAIYQSNYLLDDGKYWALDVSKFREGDETNKTMSRTTKFESVEVWTEDCYNIEPSGKWEYVNGSLTGSLNASYRKTSARNNGRNAWPIIYSSLSYQDQDALIAKIVTAVVIGLAVGGIGGAVISGLIAYEIEDNNDMVWPDDGADYINPKLKTLLKNNPDLFTGCLEVDFMNKELSRLIYSTNFNRRNQDPWNVTYQVNFDSNGGSSVESQEIVRYGLVTEPEQPVREGYNFSGWYTSPNPTLNDSFWFFDYDHVYGNMTLYAKWDESSVPYVDALGHNMPAEETEGILDNSPEGILTLSESGSTGGWYSAQQSYGGQNVGMVIDGNVNLILCDGVELKIYDGIKVPEGSSLTIWAQSTDSRTRGSIDVKKSYSDGAIGTSITEKGGSVTINGGTIKATGDTGASVIGGLETDIIINGGSVRASCDSYYENHRPAIGGVGGSVTITGGIVTAYSNSYAPAIGSVGIESTKVEISGGRVNAYGGMQKSPAIGAGSTDEGQPAADVDVTISGGRVNATARTAALEDGGWAIGGNSGIITITGGIVNAVTEWNYVPYAGIGGENCTVDLSWTSGDDSVKSCSYDGNIIIHEDKPFRFKDGTDILSVEDILNSQNKTIIPKLAMGTLTKTEAIEPTCIMPGHKAYWTDEEGNLFADEKGANKIEEPEIIPELGHDWGETEYYWFDDYDVPFDEYDLPAVENRHYYCSAIRICKRDDSHTQTQHSVATETVIAEPDCTEPGVKQLTAVFSKEWAENQTKSVEIPATGHDWGEWTVTKEATLTEEGEEIRVCGNDPSHTETRSIPIIDENATFTVTFNDEDGTFLQAYEFRYGETPVYSFDIPVKDGLTFDGWTDGYSFFEEDELPAVMKDASYAAVYSRYVECVEPRIDEEGAYILGNVAYCERDGKTYSLNEDGSVGAELESIELSYFDFKLINNGTAYQINYYTGPTENLEELVIPKTFNGKPVTVLGNNDSSETNNSKLFKNGNSNLHPFVLRLNENITEIKPYTFWAILVTKITGDTSNLSTIGKYAFSWANKAGGYTIDIKLDYEGTIRCGVGIFNNMYVTARIKHATVFNRSSFSQKSIDYIFTDSHAYTDPTWIWSEDNSTATAAFTCSCSKCGNIETVNATITRGEAVNGKVILTASAEINGVVYTDEKEIYADGLAANLSGYSVSLEGDIGVNFYMEIMSDIISHEGVYVQFNVLNTSREYQNQKVYLSDIESVTVGNKTYYVFKCRVAAKDIESQIEAQLIDGDNESTIYRYSVKEYADYLIEHQDESQTFKDAVSLVEAMLQYGAYAQNYFTGADALENLDTEVPVNEAQITALPDGVFFEGATLSLKSQTSLSLYFLSEDNLMLSMDGKIEGIDYELDHKNNEYVIRIRNISAADLNNNFTVIVNGTGFVTYSPMTYCYNAVNSQTTGVKLKNVVKALYLYWIQAYQYFNQ